jgi:hypothetical protein
LLKTTVLQTIGLYKGGIIVGNNSRIFERKHKIARVFIALLAVCLMLTAVPFLAFDGTTAVAAENTQITGTTAAGINSSLSALSSGTVVDLILGDNILISVPDSIDTNAVYDGIVIPSGITVNLYMNGKRIYYEKSSGGHWQLKGIRAIVNKGTLNIYSGASASSPNRSSADVSASSIYLVNNRYDMESDSDKERAYCRLEGISNSGTLTVNKNVTVYVSSEEVYTQERGGLSCNDATVTVATSGIYNTDSASSVVNGAKITSHAVGRGFNDRGDISETRAYAYGIYGGNVEVNGDATVTVTAETSCGESSGIIHNNGAKSVCVALGICSSKNITVNGGTFTYNSKLTDTNNAFKEGTAYIYQAGIYTTSGNTPVITDATINSATDKFTNYGSLSTLDYREASVISGTKLPYSSEALFGSGTGNLYNTTPASSSYPMNLLAGTTISGGQYKDEEGNTYSCTLSTNQDSHPSSILNGAVEGTYRVHIVYRYWTDQNKTKIDTSVVSSDGNVGYSYSPLSDGTDIVKQEVSLSGLSNGNTKTGTTGVKYESGGEVYNDNYWQLKSIAYTTTTERFSEFNVTGKKGTVIKDFTGSADSATPSNSTQPLYIFIDYVRRTPANIDIKVANSNAVYTGKPILASDIGLTVTETRNSTDCTADYNCNKNNSSKIDVHYSWTGTLADGTAVSGEDTTLPTNVGKYSVTATIDDNTEYGKDTALYKNRYGKSLTFELNITPASVTRGTLVQKVNLTYGQKLNEVLGLSSFIADGVNGEKPAGTFSFKNAVDGSGYKDAGSGTVEILWTPASSSYNYQQTSFTVNYTADKAELYLKPQTAIVTYGETDFDTAFTTFFDGLVGKELDNDTAKATLAENVQYTLSIGGYWTPYKAGETLVGTYAIKADFKNYSLDILKNYNINLVPGDSENNPVGFLTVNTREITVKASAVSRAYNPDNYSVTVKFEIIDGKYGADDISVKNIEGNLANNGAGTREVGGIYDSAVAANFTGGRSSCYSLKQITFDTGDKLTVEITKATPAVTTPTVADMFYQRNRTLADISLDAFNIDGKWQWASPSINPTVNVNSYKAVFTPSDSANYESVEFDVPVTIKPTPVVISYKGEVSYGDNIPNITAFTYTAANDPDFNIDAVTTSGNITVSTDYKQGDKKNDTGYAVYISAPNLVDVNGNYTFTTENGLITVNPREIVFTVSDSEISYGENFVAAAASVTFDESRLVGDDTENAITANGSAPQFNLTTDYSQATNGNVGTYAIRATQSFTCSENYTVKIVNGTLTVKPAVLTITAQNFTVKYNSDTPTETELAKHVKLVGAKNGQNINTVATGTIKFGTDYAKGSPVNDEGYRFYIDISEATFTNYTVSVENSTITVVKADPTITAYPSATIVYGQTLADAVFTGGTVDVAGHYEYDESATAPGWRSTPWNDYTATFIPDDTDNYNTVKNLTISLVVNKKPIEGSLAVTGNPMTGSTLTVDVSGLDPNEEGAYTYVWKDSNGVQLGTGKSLILNAAQENLTVTVTATATGYYEGTASYTTTKIAPQLTDVSEIFNTSSFAEYFSIDGMTFGGSNTVVYDGKTHSVSIKQLTGKTAYARIGDITVKYNGSTTLPKAAGTYTVTVDIATPSYTSITTDANGKTIETGTSTVVYSPATNLFVGTLVISKASYNVAFTVNDKTYDGYANATDYTYTESGKIGSDDVKLGKASFVFADANVGTGKTVTCTEATLAGADADNYTIVTSLENGGKANITARKLLAKAVAQSREYEANNYDVDLSFEINTASIASADSSASVRIDEAKAKGKAADYHAGLQKVSVSDVQLIGNKSANYVLEITNLDTLSVEIQKATPDYPIPDVGTVTYDAGKHLSDISLGDSRWQWAADVKNVVPTAGSHTYTAVYTPADTANYATVSYEVAFDVQKATVTVTAASFNITYGDNEPTYYTTVRGLTGADTVKDLAGYILLKCAYQAGSDVGTYTVSIDGRYESDNYNFVYVNGNVNVKQRTVYVTSAAVSREYDPANLNVDVTFSALSNIYSGDEGNVMLSDTTVTGTIKTADAGKKSVEYAVPELAGSKAENYTIKVLNSNLTVEITKAHVSGVALPTSATVVYGNKLATAIFTSSYEAPNGKIAMADSMSTPKGVGTFNNVYKVVYTPYNSNNYATEEAYITLTVTKAELDLDMSIAGTLQSGSKVYVVTNSLPDDAPQYIVYTWYRINNSGDDYRSSGKLVAYNTSEYTLTSSDEGCYLVCVAQSAANSPYVISCTAESDGTVEAEKLSFWQKIVKWFYRLISQITQVFGRIK